MTTDMTADMMADMTANSVSHHDRPSVLACA